MEKHYPLITATNAEELDAISKKLQSLPEAILNQIEIADRAPLLDSIRCKIKHNFQNERRIYLPNTTTQIQRFDDYVGVYADKFFFTLGEDVLKAKISYVFIPLT
jgi:hypothetical protein